jgi:hypothetical protein
MRLNNNNFGQVNQLGLITLGFCIVLLTAHQPLQGLACPLLVTYE